MGELHEFRIIGGTGLDLDLDSVYNSRDLNLKWKQSMGRDIGLVLLSEFEADFYQHDPASTPVDALVPSL
ncbi:hypothetical protein GCM10027590_35210 [Nocardiopsis nanhaiensis]